MCDTEFGSAVLSRTIGPPQDYGKATCHFHFHSDASNASYCQVIRKIPDSKDPMFSLATSLTFRPQLLLFLCVLDIRA